MFQTNFKKEDKSASFNELINIFFHFTFLGAL